MYTSIKKKKIEQIEKSCNTKFVSHNSKKKKLIIYLDILSISKIRK